jgi:hypothetical protein
MPSGRRKDEEAERSEVAAFDIDVAFAVAAVDSTAAFSVFELDLLSSDDAAAAAEASFACGKATKKRKNELRVETRVKMRDGK